MKESINLIGGLLGQVCQHGLFKCVTWKVQMVKHKQFYYMYWGDGWWIVEIFIRVSCQLRQAAKKKKKKWNRPFSSNTFCLISNFFALVSKNDANQYYENK